MKKRSQIFFALRIITNGMEISFSSQREKRQLTLSFNVISAVILGVLNLEHLNFLLRLKKIKVVF